ncbi:unnamed protein product [Larinioides sclopetarius]|uniref:Uncharacterized protein n=1 Tax=Larinioides sclopetarius TaxID=280406 RepID=A0AAV1ZXD8_9ARAC
MILIVSPLDFRELFPSTTSNTLLSGYEYTNRPSGLSLADVKGIASVQDIIRWRERILEAIDLGVVINKNGNDIVLTPEKGINILGAMVEASYESVNEKYYGNIHNQMHNLISLITDTDGRFKVKYQHLDHEPFTYHINCENNAGGPKQATVRIFLTPVYDELGNKFSLKEVEGPTRTRICVDNISYCGVKDEKYPDKKAMGFPFDRTIEALTIPEFSTPNMIFQNVKIQFKE